MASTFGSKFKVTLEGTPSKQKITVKMEGIPEGTVIDYGQISDMIRRWDDPAGRYGEDAVEEDEREIVWKTGVISFGGELGIVTGTASR